MNGKIANASLWIKAKANIIAVTGVLVAVPALINAAIDVYNIIQNVPRTNDEKVNAELFKTYFNIPPAITVPVPVKTNIGVIEMRLSVYDAGDILVEYGNNSKWFPSPLKEKQVAQTGWFPEAFAAPLGSSVKGVGEYTQTDTATAGNKIVRVRYFENGVKESFTIDINTGRIVDKKVEEIRPSALQQQNSKGVKVMNYPTIDVESAVK